MLKLKLVLFLFLPATLFCQSKKTDSTRIFSLEDQYNINGFDFNQDLPKNIPSEFKDV